MNIKAVLFDLDGTLLPMDQDVFVKAYFKGLAAKLAPMGYNPEQLIGAVWNGTMQMIKNNGQVANEEVFWDSFVQVFGEKALSDKPQFDTFYKNEFEGIKSVCGFQQKAVDTVRKLKNAGLRIVLATSPIFPEIAVDARVRWAGLSLDDFELYTTYENINYCKPNPNYYAEIANRLGVKPEECLMVGNDVGDDMIAASIGMQVFLLTDCLINKNNEDISVFPNGDFEKLNEYIEKNIV